MAIDHVLIAVDHFGSAAASLWNEHGLAAVEGGRHTGWGTANWIVPLGTGYLELVGVVDRAAAAGNDFGRRTLEVITSGGGLFAWCIAPDDFTATAMRLGLVPSAGSRARPDRISLAWRTVGVAAAMSDPSRPFFIAWDVPPDLHPGRLGAGHRVRTEGIAWVEVSGDEEVIREWIGDDDIPVRVRPGAPALLAVGIATDHGEIALR